MDSIYIYIRPINFYISLISFLTLLVVLFTTLFTQIFFIFNFSTFFSSLIIFVFIFYFTLKLIYLYKAHKPLLTFTNNGIFTYGLMARKGFIPWNDVVNYSIIYYSSLKLIGFNIKDNSMYLKNKSFIGKLALFYNSKVLGCKLEFSTHLLDTDFDTIYSMFCKHVYPKNNL